MKKKYFLFAAIALLLIAAVIFTLCLTQQSESEGILYRVTGDNGSAYLLGSIHIGTSVMHPFGDTLEAAMDSSDTFVFECDTDSAEASAQLTDRLLLPEGVSLSALLGEDLYNDTIAAYNKLSLSTATLNTQQPWGVINVLAVYSTANEMGVKDVRKAISLGIEPAVQKYAASHHKSYAYLETVDEVANTMESFSDELTRYLLQDEIDVILGRTNTSNMETVSQWPQWWHDGNIDAFRQFYSQSFDDDAALYSEYQSKLLTQRNLLMAGRLDALIQQGGTYFVTVGLLHLVYEDDSILTLLQEKGYTVEQITHP